MGKGVIISGGADGLYQVQIKYNRDRYDAMIAALDAKKTEQIENRVPVQTDYDDKSAEVDTVIAELNLLIAELLELYTDFEALQSELATLRAQLVVLEQELQDLIDQIPPAPPAAIEAKRQEIADKKVEISDKQKEISDKQKEIEEKRTEVEEKQKEANTLSFELAILGQQLAEIDLQITGIEKRIQYLEENMPADSVVGAWCADFTEDLSGSVGTVEIPGERLSPYGTLQIQPGYEDNADYDQDRDGQLFPTIATTPAQAFYNAAMLPGWQKWQPLFRHGTITAITDGRAGVTLDSSIKSSQQDLNINQATTLSGVEFEYMTCGDTAFEAGDVVLIMFTGQDFANPKIIGFKTDPKKCCPYVENFTDGSYDINWSRITNESSISFGEREEYGSYDDRFYILMSAASAYPIIRDTRYDEDLYLLRMKDDLKLNVSISLDDFTWDGDDGYFHIHLYGGVDDPVEVGEDYGHVYLVYSSTGSEPAELSGNNIVLLNDIETETEGRYTIDLSKEPYATYLKGSLRAGSSFSMRRGTVKINSFKLCAHSGEEPIIPPPAA